jgi:hypothetical protein
MKKLSQRTLVQVMRALETVPDRECFRFLYERELPDWFVIHAQSFYHFGWERILIELRNAQFFYPSHSYGGNILCTAPDFLDTELSLFMLRLLVQGAAGEPGLA